jgi:uncharacterized protein (DUF58 family)
MSSLLDAAFLRELAALRRRLLVRARSGAAGERMARRRGSSAEFLEHRPYAPGDDLRRVDWLAYARLGAPFTKLFRAEDDAVVRLIVDVSASLEGTKLDEAKRIAAGIGAMAVLGSERAQVLPARTDEAASDGILRSDVLRGKGSLPRLLRELDRLAARGGTDLGRAIDVTRSRTARPGFLVVVSDFFDPGPFASALTRARSAGHDIALVQVLGPEDVDPTRVLGDEGDFALEDAETGAEIELTLDPESLAAYRARLDGLADTLRGIARRLGATYVRTVVGESTLEACRRFVARAID